MDNLVSDSDWFIPGPPMFQAITSRRANTYYPQKLFCIHAGQTNWSQFGPHSLLCHINLLYNYKLEFHTKKPLASKLNAPRAMGHWNYPIYKYTYFVQQFHYIWLYIVFCLGNNISRIAHLVNYNILSYCDYR